MHLLSLDKSCHKSIGNVPSWNIPSRLIFAGLVGLATTGCQFREEGASQVSGRVTYHGKPVRGGSVFLIPPVGFVGTWGAGLIGDDGCFIVQTAREGVPLASGLYGVSFSRPVRPSGGDAARPAPDSIEIPAKYLDLQHPVFTIQIGSEEPIQVDITLRD
jgi:hypothetical protein